MPATKTSLRDVGQEKLLTGKLVTERNLSSPRDEPVWVTFRGKKVQLLSSERLRQAGCC